MVVVGPARDQFGDIYVDTSVVQRYSRPRGETGSTHESLTTQLVLGHLHHWPASTAVPTAPIRMHGANKPGNQRFRSICDGF